MLPAFFRLAAELECHNSSHQRFFRGIAGAASSVPPNFSLFVHIAGEGSELCNGAPGFAHRATAPTLRSQA